MNANIINGHLIAENIRIAVKASSDKFFDTYKIKPGLAVIIIGDNPASHAYVNIKLKRCVELGLHAEALYFPLDVESDTVLTSIDHLNTRTDIHGIILQLPLPGHLSTHELVNRIAPKKDVDGLCAENLGALYSHYPGIIPCTPKGILKLLKTLPEGLTGKHAVVIGRSLIVGKPMATLLLSENCTVTQIHSYSKDWADLTQMADIIVTAAGVPGLINASHIKPGAIVVDVGSTRIVRSDGTAVFMGDVDSSVYQKAGYITPVPGGVGPMTVAMLLENTVNAAWDQQNVR